MKSPHLPDTFYVNESLDHSFTDADGRAFGHYPQYAELTDHAHPDVPSTI